MVLDVNISLWNICFSGHIIVSYNVWKLLFVQWFWSFPLERPPMKVGSSAHRQFGKKNYQSPVSVRRNLIHPFKTDFSVSQSICQSVSQSITLFVDEWQREYNNISNNHNQRAIGSKFQMGLYSYLVFILFVVFFFPSARLGAIHLLEIPFW